MSGKEKLVSRFLSRPKDFTWSELLSLLSGFGYVQADSGKTGGSRRKFLHPKAPMISLHKPHPGNLLKKYQIEQVLSVLKDGGLL